MPEVRIPGLSSLVDKATAEKITSGIVLLMSPPSGGKTLFCRQMITDSLQNGSGCIYINSSITRKEYENLFNQITDANLKNLKFMNPYLMPINDKEADSSASINEPKLSATLQEIRKTIDEWSSSVTNQYD
jgi:archaellum biogenesis ATPase FlaH